MHPTKSVTRVVVLEPMPHEGSGSRNGLRIRGSRTRPAVDAITRGLLAQADPANVVRAAWERPIRNEERRHDHRITDIIRRHR